jgi:uncharacterized membrane protein (UPF0182 family)
LSALFTPSHIINDLSNIFPLLINKIKIMAQNLRSHAQLPVRVIHQHRNLKSTPRAQKPKA